MTTELRRIAFRKAAIRYHTDPVSGVRVAEIFTGPSGMPAWVWRLCVILRLRLHGIGGPDDEPLCFGPFDVWTAS